MFNSLGTRIRALFALALGLLAAQSAGAQSSGGASSGSSGRYTWNPIQRSEIREKSRWSLSEWLATKERNRLMDMWLAIHTPSPYEFFFSYDYAFAEEGLSRFRISRAGAGFYAQIFGIEGSYENAAVPRFSAFFNLRLLGFDSQGTNLTFQLGVRAQREPTGEQRGATVGGHLTLNIMKAFGIYALHRQFLQSTADSAGNRSDGHRTEAQAFIDIRLLRLYGGYFWEALQVEGPNASSRSTSGPYVGLKLFF